MFRGGTPFTSLPLLRALLPSCTFFLISLHLCIVLHSFLYYLTLLLPHCPSFFLYFPYPFSSILLVPFSILSSILPSQSHLSPSIWLLRSSPDPYSKSFSVLHVTILSGRQEVALSHTFNKHNSTHTHIITSHHEPP